MKKIVTTLVTHNGQFHADEVFASAIIKYFFGDVHIIRTRNENLLDEFKKNEKVFVIDVGSEYSPTQRNFDHHQDLSLSSSAGLIWNYYAYNNLRPNIVDRVYNDIIKSIDWIDTNKYDVFSKLDTFTNSFPEKFRFPGISKTISLFNRDSNNDNVQLTQFLKAVDFSTEILHNAINYYTEIEKDDISWKNRFIYNNFAYIFNIKCDSWYEKRNEDLEQINYSVQPRGIGFGLKTIDSKNYPLPTYEEVVNILSIQDIIFVHKARFLIVVENMSAIYRILDYMLENKKEV